VYRTLPKPSAEIGILALLFLSILSPVRCSAQILTTLASLDQNSGSYTYSTLVEGSDGNLYGTAWLGGAYNSSPCFFAGCGTIYKVSPSGSLTVLYNFCPQSPCPDGFSPVAGLLLAQDGNLYGTTTDGAPVQSGGYGTIFRLTMQGGGISLTTLHRFNGLDGTNPDGSLIQASDGNLYGITVYGGTNFGCQVLGQACGTIYKVSPSGAFTTLHNFCSEPNCTDGALPYAGLIQAADGNLYGTTLLGGSNDSCGVDACGTIFKMSPSGQFTTVHSFTLTDGSQPFAPLVQDNNGNLYGTTYEGGLYNGGVVFKVGTDGSVTTLHDFCPEGSPVCPDGLSPAAGLVKASDGNFYGSTEAGGMFNSCQGVACGTIFTVTPGGIWTQLYSFQNIDGAQPYGGLIVGRDGDLYGTTVLGGTSDNCGSDIGCGTVFSMIGPGPHPAQFVPLIPCRLLDTRQSGQPIQGGTFQDYLIPQSGSCNVPASAIAYSLNVTVAPLEPLGFLSIWPMGEDPVDVSTMNSLDGRTKANAAIVPAGGNGGISVFASNTTDLVLDIDGYFTAPGSQTLEFYPLVPCRVIDTRNPNGDLGGPSLAGGTPRNFPVTESSCLQGISNPQAYSFNFTVVPTQQNPGQPLGYLTVWPQGGSQPTVSTLNNPTATAVANAAIVPAGSNGGVSVFASNNTDMIVDINGYFAAPATGGLSLYPVAPCRVLDTRQVGSGNPIVGQYPVNVVGSVCAPPASAQAYVFNATVVPSGPLGYLTLWPDGSGQPTVSTLNALDGFVTSNMAVVPSTNGSIDAFASNLTQLVLDISSYFAP